MKLFFTLKKEPKPKPTRRERVHQNQSQQEKNKIELSLNFMLKICMESRKGVDSNFSFGVFFFFAKERFFFITPVNGRQGKQYPLLEWKNIDILLAKMKEDDNKSVLTCD